MRKGFLVLFIIACVTSLFTFIVAYYNLASHLIGCEWRNGLPVFGLEIIAIILIIIPIAYAGGVISLILLGISLHSLSKALKIVAIVLIAIHALCLIGITVFYLINGYVKQDEPTEAITIWKLIKGY